ncbi:3-hydroxyacyl-thioester dehydratase HtdZ [Georgenia halophila]|uniref:3-hydroxyacyl-thioester dehydratase HtdZ n=1 Tax=Georgenia halophila TaxID=620889 RepID=A0ABP8LNQ5_9MICO
MAVTEPEAEHVLRASVGELPRLVGKPFGPSAWRTITQDEVQRFADLTGDDNPIHTDEAAGVASPFGTTVVHGYLTLALVVPLMAEVLVVDEVGTGVNYGIDKLRFPAPVPVGSRVRLSGTVADVTEVSGGYQLHADVAFETEGWSKPACVARLVLRYYR